jgi:2,4-dienoyl-CoA reductase (NADPH2)
MQQYTVQTPYMVGEVHFYTKELDQGLALFDTGPPTDEGKQALLENVEFEKLKYIFITHCHVDHYGLAEFVSQNSGAELYIGRRDALKLSRHRERLVAIASLLSELGFSDEFIQKLRESFSQNQVFPGMPLNYRVIEDSPEVRDLGVSWISCPGHSQSDIVYLTGDYAVTGDLLLRNIFQAPLLDIDLETFSGRFRNYEAYCSSLLSLSRLQGYKIMPGHRHYVVSLDEAILFYVRTMLERALQVFRYKELPMPELIDRLFEGRISEPFFVYLKLSEVIFMLDFIENPDLLKLSLQEIGLFSRVDDLFTRFV